MNLFHISLVTLMFRFYLMMAIVVIAGFSGVWWLSMLALPVFFSALMGIQFKRRAPIKKADIGRSFGAASRQPHTAHE